MTVEMACWGDGRSGGGGNENSSSGVASGDNEATGAALGELDRIGVITFSEFTSVWLRLRGDAPGVAGDEVGEAETEGELLVT